MIYLVMTAHHPDGGSAGLMVAMFDPTSWANFVQLPDVVRLHNALEMRVKVPVMFVAGSKQDLVGLSDHELVEAVAYGTPGEAGAAVIYGDPARFEFFGFRSATERVAFKGDVVLAGELQALAGDNTGSVVFIVPERRTLKRPSLPQSRYAH